MKGKKLNLEVYHAAGAQCIEMSRITDLRGVSCFMITVYKNEQGTEMKSVPCYESTVYENE
jgi:hypothetical protein